MGQIKGGYAYLPAIDMLLLMDRPMSKFRLIFSCKDGQINRPVCDQIYI